MKILFLDAYHTPESIPYTYIEKGLLEALTACGHTVEILCPTPCRGLSKEEARSYADKKEEYEYGGKVLVRRFSAPYETKNVLVRALRYFLCNAKTYFAGIKSKDIDAVFAASTPPTQGYIGTKVAKKLSKKYGKHVPFVYNLQDIFPDSLVNAGLTKNGSLLWRIGRKLEDKTYAASDRIIVISGGFRKNIAEKGVPAEKIEVVPNWADVDSIRPVVREENVLFDRYGLDRNRFYICYSGNIGHSQNIGLLIEAASRLEKELPEACFVLFGEGAAKEELKRAIDEAGLGNLVLLPFQPYEDIAHVFSFGDAGLIISKPGIGKSSVPSKTWGIMAAERPVLASFDNDSELASLIGESGCGVCADAGDIRAFVASVKKMLADKDALCEMGKNGKRYLTEYLDKEKCVGQYIRVLKECAEKGAEVQRWI